MKIEFDPSKDTTNQAKHGVSLRLAEELDWATAVTWEDMRLDYGERRSQALGYLRGRIYSVVFTDRGGMRRIISLRKANERETRRYAKAQT